MWANAASQALAGLGVAILGILVLVAERVLPAPEHGQRPDMVRQLVRLTGRVLLTVSVAVLAAPLVPTVAIALALVIVALSWRTGWISIMGSLATAAERGVPFDTVLEALAAEERGPARRRAHRLVELLRMGWPLPDALEQVRNPVGWECLAAIRVGHAVGDLATPLRRAYRRLAGKEDSWADLWTRLFYLLVTVVYLLGVAFFFRLRLMPAFAKILQDFDINLPPITVAVESWFLGGTIGLRCLNWLAFAIWLVVALLAIYGLLRYTGLIRWVPPGVDWLVRPFRAADVLDALAVAVRRDCPLAGPLAILSHEYPGWVFRRRLRRVYGDVQAGADWYRSLHRRRVIGKAEALVLEAASRAGNLAWALEEMAASLRRRHAYRLRALAMGLFPLCVVALGAVVGLFFVGYFYPLVTLIESLTTL